MTPWRRTLLLRRFFAVQAENARMRSVALTITQQDIWLNKAANIAKALESGAITDRHAERLMAELGECP